MKKIVALLLTLALLISCTAGLAETYFGNTVYAEAGYENDCYNGVAKVLHLYEDGTFELIDNTSIIQVSYIVVTTGLTSSPAPTPWIPKRTAPRKSP